MQFGANEDIDNYPKTLSQDQEKLIAANCDLLFTPTPEIIYPKGLENQTYIEVPGVSEGYCGESRPGHFRGVATVVCKLFNLVQPDVACFGLKDYQQVQVITSMVEDLSLPIQIVPVATIREASGLAMSSRNGYLTAEELEIAPTLYQTLVWLKEQLLSNKELLAEEIDALTKQAAKKINHAGMTTDYIHVSDARNLTAVKPDDKNLVILAAAHCGKARLIDNILVDL
jgi:pantoate--beta-alanine ligase